MPGCGIVGAPAHRSDRWREEPETLIAEILRAERARSDGDEHQADP